MTAEDQRLDINDLFRQTLLYRLARARYANLSGVGAAAYPGRWNRLGQEALYTSANPATTVLERLVHTPKDVIPSNLAMLTITFRGEWHSTSTSEYIYRDLETSANIAVFDCLQTAEQYYPDITDQPQWEGENLLAIAVPSVIVPAWNIVFYTRHLNFREHVGLVNVERFEFDPRLFPERF